MSSTGASVIQYNPRQPEFLICPIRCYGANRALCISALSAPALSTSIHSVPLRPVCEHSPILSTPLVVSPFANPLLACWTSSQTRLVVLKVDIAIKLFQASGIMLLSMRGTLDEAICHTDRIALSGFSGTQQRIKARTDSSILFPPLFSSAACLSVTCKHKTSIMCFFVLSKSLSLMGHGLLKPLKW